MAEKFDALKMAGLCALAGVFVFVSLAGLAYLNFPDYSITENFLSDLGALESSAPYFNAATVFTGFSLVLFAYLLYRGGFRWLLSLWSLTVAGLGLAGVGIFQKHPALAFYLCDRVLPFRFLGVSFRRGNVFQAENPWRAPLDGACRFGAFLFIGS